ncbi:PepSY-associated TM helix domain-containing protein [Pontibacter sp. G13]|uniref:PepSY-associated TM helix domain-containing protein n=1 Tax=Pontibacter sp. G13 TaxID=3074898 RepID=UPI00288A44B2|nr:PepSY-associated TM helix domain-containing protein [Pontibacter sp. G13]WNJ17877.1 PepSY-associated TM helix domain-containing protein [Pontibacter sp. G13]
MTFKQIIGKLHLWLGLSSGLVVFIVAITGCIYAFQEEIQDLTQPYRFVKVQNKAFLPPTELIANADKAVPGEKAHAIQYYGPGRATKVIYYETGESYYHFVYIDPYSGIVQKVHDESFNFFRVVLGGHFYLWLPAQIGQPVVATFTLIFAFLLISGLVLWWPKNKMARKQRFSIKWDARWRRKNYDLHNVLGFYILSIGLVFAITGLVWGFEWFRDGFYAATSGGEAFIPYEAPLSDSTATYALDRPVLDVIYDKLRAEHPSAPAIELHPQESHSSPIAVNINPDPGTYWQLDYRYFDAYTLEELSVDHIWGRYEQADGADLLMRMNYDIHVGAIAGFAGKLLAFFISLIIASLPITGFVIWYGRRKKQPKATRKARH